MSTDTNQTLFETGNVAPPAMAVDAPTQNQTPNTIPSGNINSSNLLSQLTHTGYTVRMKLPVAADLGPVPLFAFRVDPIAPVPNLKQQLKEALTKDENVYPNLPPETRERLSVVTFNGCECHLTGSESPQSLFARACRFRRYDMTYALRFSYQYSGSGLFAVVPFKGVPFGQQPLRDDTMGGSFISAYMFNSYALADGSRTREIKFTYPWEYPFKYRDMNLDMNAASGGDFVNLMYPENWFVVFARGSFNAPDNVPFIDIMIDHALTTHEFITPYLCHRGMYMAQIPTVTSGEFKRFISWVNYTADGKKATDEELSELTPVARKKVIEM